MKFLVPLGAFLFFTTFGLADDWVVLEGCRLVKSDYADGDSFHVIHRGKNLHLRLYAVDCPETDDRFKDRLRSQARYFKVNRATLLAAGQRAHDFTAGQLASPFTVITRWQDAEGASQQQRFFGLVKTAAGRDLGELLVGAGWARAYGAPADYPNTAAATRMRNQLDDLESTARSKRLGIWGMSKVTANPSPRPNSPPADRPEKDGDLTDDFIDTLNDLTR
ncbi:MAG: thermonuclease family protein [Terrimicrobiaceae bacterium]|nr:thermonuclease family protein [Terrimicrobiaceae bacterium]